MKKIFTRFICDHCVTAKLRIYYCLIIFFIVATTFISAVRPELQGDIVDMLAQIDVVNQRAFWLMMVVFLLLLLVGYLLEYFKKYISTVIVENIGLSLRQRIDIKLQNIQPEYYQDASFSDVLVKIEKNVASIKQCGLTSIITLFSNVIMLIVIIPLMMSVDELITIISIFAFLLIPILNIIIGRKIQKSSATVLASYKKMISTFDDNFHKWWVIRIFNRYTIRNKHNNDANTQYTLDTLRQAKHYISSFIFTVIIQFLATSVIWLLGAYKIFNAQMSVGVIISLMSFQAIIMTPITTLTSLFNDFNTARVSLKELFIFFDEKEICKYTIVEHCSSHDITLKVINLSFTYKSNTIPVINSFSYQFQSGKLYAISGISGCGKSTLLNILAGLISTPDETIFINEVCMTTEKLLCNSSVVLQRIALFNDTLIKNICEGKAIVTPTIETICQRLDILDDILSLPEKWESIIDEKISNFSEGQLKRIEIVRAINKKAALYLFDEASSPLDTKRRALFYKELHNLSRNSVVIFITHNLDELNYADIVLEFSEGGEIYENRRR